VGIPEIKPEVVRFNPEGNDPEDKVKVIAPCPPEVCSWDEYGCPTVPDERGEGVVIFGGMQGAGLTVREKAVCTVCAPKEQLSVALIVKE